MAEAAGRVRAAARKEASRSAPSATEDERSGPWRRCIASGVVRPAAEMLRFVIGPDGAVVPDIAGRLPGRGLWLGADRAMLDLAVTRNLFAKAARRAVGVPADLAQRVDGLLAARCIEMIGLARRAGQAVAGYEKVRGALKSGRGALLLAASDGAADGRDKLSALAPRLPVLAALTGAELGRAFGRDHAVHGLLEAGGLADRVRTEAGRLAGLRSPGCKAKSSP